MRTTIWVTNTWRGWKKMDVRNVGEGEMILADNA